MLQIIWLFWDCLSIYLSLCPRTLTMSLSYYLYHKLCLDFVGKILGSSTSRQHQCWPPSDHNPDNMPGAWCFTNTSFCLVSPHQQLEIIPLDSPAGKMSKFSTKWHDFQALPRAGHVVYDQRYPMPLFQTENLSVTHKHKARPDYETQEVR